MVGYFLDDAEILAVEEVYHSVFEPYCEPVLSTDIEAAHRPLHLLLGSHPSLVCVPLDNQFVLSSRVELVASGILGHAEAPKFLVEVSLHEYIG
jgi:hypothetical protein